MRNVLLRLRREARCAAAVVGLLALAVALSGCVQSASADRDGFQDTRSRYGYGGTSFGSGRR